MSIIDQIKNEIEHKHKSSNGKCGLYIVELCDKIELDYNTIRPHLESLYKEKFFTVKEGINGKLLFKK